MTAPNQSDVGVAEARQALTITESAEAKINGLRSKHPEADGLRIAVRGGGCNGLEYHFEMDAKGPRDTVFTYGDATVITDPKSLIYLDGSELNYVKTLMKEEFELTNPNATSSCGCGASFTV